MLKTHIRKQMLKSKKAQGGMNKIPSAVLLMGISVVIGVLMAIIVSDVASTTSDANATEIAAKGASGITKVFSFFVLIGLVLAAGIVLKILTNSLS